MSMKLALELRKASIKTFGDLAFMLPTEAAIPEQGELPVTNFVRVFFYGPVDGRLTLGLSAGLLDQLAANMLGCDTVQEETLKHDALKEAANVLCGNFLPEIYGVRAMFRLSEPELLLFENVALDSWQARIDLEIEDGRCEVRFYQEGA